MSKIINPHSQDYQKLVAGLRAEMAKGIRAVEEFVERHKVITSWNMGRDINAYLDTHEPAYGGIGAFYTDLSKDLEINERTLQQCAQFFRFFPKLPSHSYLKWSHYRFLMTVPDAAQRAKWIERIQKERIPPDELRLALMPQSANDDLPKFNLKSPVRGKLYTYRLLRADDVENFETPWFVDAGFAGRREAPPSKAVLDNKNLYTSEKAGGEYTLKVVRANVDELFTFRGKIRRWVDADTPLVIIDQGFSMWIEQRLRLIGIDAPEKGTLAEERARKWVENELKDCGNIVLKTYKSDNWDRYLVDLYYIPKEKDMRQVAAQGIWLNSRMVEKGIAKIWKK